MKELGLPLVQHLRADWQDFNPAQPDDWQKCQWPTAQMFENQKPDGN